MAWKNVLEFVSSLVNLKANVADELLTGMSVSVLRVPVHIDM